LEHLEDRLAPAIIDWTGGVNGTGTQWLDASNWVVRGSMPPAHQVPGANDDAIISGGGTTIILDASTSVHRVDLQHNVHITNGTLSVAAAPSRVGTTVTALELDGGTLDVASGATISGQLAGAGTFAIAAGRTVFFEALSLNCPFVNNGVVVAHALNAFNSGATNAPGATLQLQGDTVLGTSGLQLPSGLTNNGTIQMTSNDATVGARLDPIGTLTNAVGATFDVAAGSGGERRITLGNATFVNQGTTTVSTDLFVPLPGTSHFTTSGTLTINPGATVMMDGNGGVSSFDYQTGALNGGGVLNIQALAVNISSGATLTNGPLVFATTVGNFVTAINGPGTLANSAGATLNLASTVVNAPFTNAGTANLRAGISINGGLTASSNATTRILGDSAIGNAVVSIGAGGLSNAGAFEMTSTGASATDDSLSIGNGGTFTNTIGSTFKVLAGVGGSRSIGGPFVNQGTMTVSTDLSFSPTFTTFTNSGTLTIQPGATLSLLSTIFDYQAGAVGGSGTLYSNSRINIGAGLTLTNGSTLAIQLVGTEINGPGTLANAAGATFEPRNVTMNALLTNAGTLNFRGNDNVYGGYTTTVGATTRVLGDDATGPASVTFQSVSLTNNGLFELTSLTGTNAASLTVSGGASFTNASGATFNVLAGSGGSRTITSNTFSNAGVFNLTGTNMTLDNSFGSVANSGTMTLGAGTTLTQGINGTLNNMGTLAGGGILAGRLSGSGTVSPGSSPGRLTINGDATFGGFVAELNGLTAGTQYDQLVVNGTVTLSGTLTASLGFGPAYGGGFTIIDNDGTDPINGTFAGGPTLTIGGVPFAISYTGGTGNDVVLTPIAQVFNARVNDGAIQRSRVTSLTVSFNTLVNFSGAVASAFTLTRAGGGAVAFSASATVIAGGTVVTLDNFSGSEIEFGSLRDGRYTLTALASQISNTAGQLNSGTNFTFGDAQGLFRFFGDVNGDQTVNGFDLGFFRNAFGTQTGDSNYLSYLDLNGDGVINGFDLGQFRNRFGTMLP
jgi:hypothetical protein